MSIIIFSPKLSWEEFVNKAERPIRYRLLAGKQHVATLSKSNSGKLWYCFFELPDVKLRKEYWPLDELMTEASTAVLDWFSGAMDECHTEVNPHLNSEAGA